MIRNITILLFTILLLNGCSWFDKEYVAPVTVSRYSKTSKIVNVQKIQSGGSVYIIPFSAGPGVEADDQLDRISLLIIKGIDLALEENDSSLTVVLSEDRAKADFVLEGRITEMVHPSKWKKWVLRSKDIKMGVNAKLIDRKTNETVVFFSDTRDAGSVDNDFEQLAIFIGKDIGSFIASAE